MVGADGVDSVVRSELFHGTRSRYAGFSAWRAVIPSERADPASPGETIGRGQLFGVVPIGPQMIYWFAAAPAPQHPPRRGESNREELLRRFGEWHDPIPGLVRDTPEDRILYHPIQDVPKLPAWSVGRATLLGDAAHAMTPNLGQGACQALEDAVVLGETLAGESDPVLALDVYQRARLRRAARIATRSRWMSKVALADQPLAVALRDLSMGLAPAAALTRGLRPILTWDPRQRISDQSATIGR